MKKSEINILIIDDDETFLNALNETVKSAGYKTTPCSSIEDALSSVKLRPTHAAIIDCMLPKMNGVQVSTRLREGRFGSSPIFLMSGVFRDKTFANDSLKKVNADDFLFKPFDTEDLISKLDEKLNDLIDIEKVPLHALLSKPYASQRERRKAMDQIEEIVGYDLPLIFSILMDAESSGHLNIYTASGGIIGVSLDRGRVAKVDTDTSAEKIEGLLLNRGFVTENDLQEIGNKRKGDILKALLGANLLSPHVGSIVQAEQMAAEIREMFTHEEMQINFVPDEITEPGARLDFDGMGLVIHEAINGSVPSDWLKNFYSDWMDHAIQTGPQFSKDHPVFGSSIVQKTPALVDLITKQITIEEILEQTDFDEADFFKTIHLLAIRRIIVFDDMKRAKNIDELISKLQITLREIEGKNYYQVFQYFGAGDNPSKSDVEKIYREFAKNNHPDTLPPNVPEDSKKIVHTVFTIVSEAYDTLSNEGKRKLYRDGLRQKEAENQIKAENAAEDAVALLRRGQAKKAFELMTDVISLYENYSIRMVYYWTVLSVKGDIISKDEQVDIENFLKRADNDDRQRSTFYLVTAMLQKSQGKFEDAKNSIDKGFTIDGKDLDLRRELKRIESEEKEAKKSKDNSFSGELTAIVGNLFKKR